MVLITRLQAPGFQEKRPDETKYSGTSPIPSGTEAKTAIRASNTIYRMYQLLVRHLALKSFKSNAVRGIIGQLIGSLFLCWNSMSVPTSAIRTGIC